MAYSCNPYVESCCNCKLVPHAAVGLGCLGPAAGVEVDIVESYDVEQRCYTMPVPEYLLNFHQLVGDHHSVSTFANFGDGVVEWTFQRDRVPVRDTPPCTPER